jgi:hypothetical protein
MYSSESYQGGLALVLSDSSFPIAGAFGLSAKSNAQKRAPETTAGPRNQDRTMFLPPLKLRQLVQAIRFAEMAGTADNPASTGSRHLNG